MKPRIKVYGFLILYVILQGTAAQKPICVTKGIFVALNGECNKYARCDGKDVPRAGFLCPAGLSFDPFKHKCIPAAEATDCKVCFGREGQRFRIKNRDDKFYQCVDSTPLSMQCKPTSYFDAQAMKCVKRTVQTQTTNIEINIDEPEVRSRKRMRPKKTTTTTTPAPTEPPPPKKKDPENTHNTITIIETLDTTPAAPEPEPEPEPPTDDKDPRAPEAIPQIKPGQPPRAPGAIRQIKPGQPPRQVIHLNQEAPEEPIRVSSALNIMSKSKPAGRDDTVLDHAVELLDTGTESVPKAAAEPEPEPGTDGVDPAAGDNAAGDHAGAGTDTKNAATKPGLLNSIVKPVTAALGVKSGTAGGANVKPGLGLGNVVNSIVKPVTAALGVKSGNAGGAAAAGTGSADYNTDAGGNGPALSAAGDGSLVDLSALKNLGGKIESYAVDDGEDAGEVVDEEVV